MLTLYHSRAGRGERPTNLASARLPANVAWLDLLNPVPDETSPQPLGSGRRNDPPPLLADDACQEPKVCRLTAGGRRIRTSCSARKWARGYHRPDAICARSTVSRNVAT